MNQISDRVKNVVQSDIRRMSRECERVGGINLGQGICDLPTIPELVEGACDAIASSKATYSKFEGIDILRERIAHKAAHFNNYRVDPASEIVVTVGATGGFATSAMATLNAGDEVILFEPYYGYHLNTLRILGIETKFVSGCSSRRSSTPATISGFARAACRNAAPRHSTAIVASIK